LYGDRESTCCVIASIVRNSGCNLQRNSEVRLSG
jgi:hypothetical protein